MEYGGERQQESVIFQDEEGRKVGVIVGRFYGIGIYRMPQVCEEKHGENWLQKAISCAPMVLSGLVDKMTAT